MNLELLRVHHLIVVAPHDAHNQVPVADYRLTQSLGALPGQGVRDFEEGEKGAAKSGHQDRSCYSFCMCPGGQVVPTSVDPKEVRPLESTRGSRNKSCPNRRSILKF